MISFFKTLGLGILYFLLLPFLLIYYVIFGIYLFFKNVFYVFLINSKKYKHDLNEAEQRANEILSNNKYDPNIKETVKESIGEIKNNNESRENEKIVYHTTNNIYVSSLQDAQKVDSLINNSNNNSNYIENMNDKFIEIKSDEPAYIDDLVVNEDEDNDNKKNKYEGMSSLRRKD